MGRVVLVAIAAFWLLVVVLRRRRRDNAHSAGESMSRREATDVLGVSERRVTFWIACERLLVVPTDHDRVTVASVQATVAWWNDATPVRRFVGSCADVCRYMTGLP